MLSQEAIESFRRMTPSERLQLAMAVTDENEPYLLLGSPEVVARRFELLRRENDLRNLNMLRALAASKAKQ